MTTTARVCTPDDMRPYNCDGAFGGTCEHCERRLTDAHDPATCALCDPAYDHGPPYVAPPGDVIGREGEAPK